MAIYIRLNRNYYSKYPEKKYNDLREILGKICNTDLISSIERVYATFRILKSRNKFESQYEDSELSNLETIPQIIKKFKEYIKRSTQKRRLISFSIISNIRLYVSKQFKESIPIKITIFAKSGPSGDLSIELTKDDVDFDDYFQDRQDFKKKNRKILFQFLKKIQLKRLGPKGRKVVTEINVGITSLPFDNIKSALYIYRSSPSKFYKDLIKFLDYMKDFFGDLNPNEYSGEDARKIKQIQHDILKPYTDFDYFKISDYKEIILKTITNRNKHITSYFEKKAEVYDGSISIHSKEEDFPTLYKTFYDFHKRINEMFAEILKPKENIKREFDKKIIHNLSL